MLITRLSRKVLPLTVGLLVFSLLLAGCGGGSSGTVSSGPTATVAATIAATHAPTDTPTPSGPQVSVKIAGSISSFAFSPLTLTIKVGTTVVWTNSTAAPHTSSSDAGSAVTWDSGAIDPGETFSFTFTQTGTFKYHCNIHPTMQHGTITVTS